MQCQYHPDNFCKPCKPGPCNFSATEPDSWDLGGEEPGGGGGGASGHVVSPQLESRITALGSLMFPKA